MSRKLWFMTGAVLAVAIGVTVVTAQLTRDIEDEQRTAAFDRLSWDHLAAVEQALQSDLEVIRALTEFVAHDPTVSPDEFQTFAARLVKGHAGMAMVSWAPRAGAGSYPIATVAPLPETAGMIGFDLTGEAVRRGTLARAVETRSMALSPLVTTLVAGDTEVKGILVFSPVFAAERGAPHGVVVGVLRLDQLARSAMGPLRDFPGGHPMRLRIFDLSGGPDPVPLFVAMRPEDQGRPRPEALSSLHTEKTIAVADRKWRLVSVASAAFLDVMPLWTSRLVMGAGLVVSVLLAGLAAMIGRAIAARRTTMAHLEAVVAKRTRDLALAEADARALANQNELLLQSVGEGIYGVDTHGITTFVNDAALSMLGYGRDELIGSNQHAILHHTHADGRPYPAEDCPIVATFRDGGTHRTTDEVFWRKDGTSVPVEFVSTPVKSGDAVVGAVVAFRDISERKANAAARRLAEAERQATADRLNMVLETVGEGVIGINDESRVMFANRAAAEALGWPSPEEMLDRAIGEVTGHILADGRPCRHGFCAIRGTLSDGSARRVSDETFSGLLGKAVPVEYVVSPVMVGGSVAGAVVAFHDISDRKAVEEELRRSNGELEQFAYVVSHDLRQPLRMITSYTHLLDRQLGGALDEDSREFMGFIRDGGTRMDQMLVSLLEYSRVGRRGEPTQEIESRALVEEALLYLRPAIEEAGGVVQLSGNWPLVVVSRNEGVRLFQNLIGNALKYHLPDRPPVVDLSVEPDDEAWRFTVRDNGIGIDPTQFGRLFRVFQRLHARERYEGTGIGLAVCRKIVERLGGHIWVESDGEGHGCTFRFTLPMAATAARALETA